MSRYLLDINALADCVFRRRGVHERVRAARIAGHKIGIEYSATRDANLDVVNRTVGLFRLWPFTPDAAREYGRRYADLRRRGRTIQTVDLMIAAIALTLGGCTIVTRDSDLSHVTGLNVENWATSG